MYIFNVHKQLNFLLTMKHVKYTHTSIRMEIMYSRSRIGANECSYCIKRRVSNALHHNIPRIYNIMLATGDRHQVSELNFKIH